KLSVVIPGDAEPGGPGEPERRIAARVGIRDQRRPADGWLLETVRWTWRVKLMPSLALDAEQRLREQAEAEAIRVFGRNLHDLLLAAPAGQRPTMGLDPGIRTGVKVAVVDGTGKLLDTATIYPHEPRNDWKGALRVLGTVCRRHNVELIAIGNGTASRETDKLAGELIAREPDLRLTRVVVSEAGASVYSASASAALEFPDLDVSLRGAVSIARRLQDPLAELVRIEPKAIGVGQYQHDVSQAQLARKLDAVVEDCVNAVGADVNTASVPLLARISGLSEALARNIVSYRDQHGAFRTRSQLKKVPRIGERTFQQAAGFLRISNGAEPLDASAVHPEAYPVVEAIAAKAGLSARALIGNTAALRALRPEQFADDRFGLPTVTDIFSELEKPGRDPRPEFKTASFKEGIDSIGDLQPGIRLEGVVTNVANFGAFVDIGVHQDGLVHVSQLADRFVKDPRDVVKAGDIVTVTVIEVDLKRKRIALSMKSQAGQSNPRGPQTRGPNTARPPMPATRRPAERPHPAKEEQGGTATTAMSAAFAKLRNR
ncbi:MAG: helix-hairpin-helix domain-containing protein, partial [Vicinamibacterales bacterium]